ncbi:unnamed protein product [Cochlearia groenlandica]
MGMSLDYDVDLEKGTVDYDIVYTQSPKKPSKPVKPGEKTGLSPVQCAISKPGLGKTERKEKRNNKSACKPPRPPRGPSLDAADQKLIREIAELAMLKRARIERLRALKKSRDAKAASAASSLGNVLATVFSAIFFFVLVIQGLSPKASSGQSHVEKANVGFGSVQYAGNPYASQPDRGYTEPVLAHRSSSKLEPVSGLENQEKMNRVS